MNPAKASEASELQLLSQAVKQPPMRQNPHVSRECRWVWLMGRAMMDEKARDRDSGIDSTPISTEMKDPLQVRF